MDNLPGEKERHSLSHLHGLFPRDPIIPLPRLNPRHLVVYVLHILIDILLWRVGDYIDLHVVSVIVYIYTVQENILYERGKVHLDHIP